jgi:hypothetical protein
MPAVPCPAMAWAATVTAMPTILLHLLVMHSLHLVHEPAASIPLMHVLARCAHVPARCAHVSAGCAHVPAMPTCSYMQQLAEELQSCCPYACLPCHT